jgi:hypothetical protein
MFCDDTHRKKKPLCCNNFFNCNKAMQNVIILSRAWHADCEVIPNVNAAGQCSCGLSRKLAAAYEGDRLG